MIPLSPHGVVVGAVAVFFSDILGRQLDEFSAPIILPVMLLAILIYEKFSRHTLHLFSLFLAPMLVLSFMGIADGYQVLVSGEIPGGTSAAELEAALWSETWRNLLMILFLGVHYGSALLSRNNSDPVADYPPEEGVSEKLEGSLRFATGETAGHIGAMLMLIALSVGTAGIIERSGMLALLPDAFASIWIAGLFLVVALVLVGMFIDPLGAVILVNATFAPLAAANGIAPLHFWMIALVAFELGYLTPPVALNHLLTRQVVGDDEVESARLSTGTFFRR